MAYYDILVDFNEKSIIFVRRKFKLTLASSDFTTVFSLHDSVITVMCKKLILLFSLTPVSRFISLKPQNPLFEFQMYCLVVRLSSSEFLTVLGF